MATKQKKPTEKKQFDDWDVMRKMVEEGKDIRAFRHILGIDLKGRKGNHYSELKIQIDEETHQDIAELMFSGFGPKKKIVICYVIDRAQFDEIKLKHG